MTGYFAALGADPAGQRAVVESTSTWYWLADHLRVAGVGRTRGHSKYIQAIRYAKGKTDAVDAATLAQRLRSDLIPAAHMVSPDMREPRDLLRQRLGLGAKRTPRRTTRPPDGADQTARVPAPADADPD